MKRLVKGIKYWLQLLLLPIYWFSFLVPRNKKIWLFGSTFGNRFADNPRYAYLYINQFHNKQVRCVWISHNKDVVSLLRSKGCEAYYNKSLKGMLYCLVGGVYIYDNYTKDISFWLSGGAIKINLWHGTATKKINKDNKFDYYRNPRTKWEKFVTAPRRLSDEKPHHYILATSRNMAPILSGAFGTDLKHTLVVGHPRNDILMRNDIVDIHSELEEKTISALKNYKEKGKKLIFYVPTFRESESEFFRVMNLEKLNSYLVDKNIILCTKLHIKSKLRKDFAKITSQAIINIDADVDPAVILPFCDIMIADYSSIYLDYLFLGRPAIAFPFDYKEYITSSRECYFEYDDYMPEDKAYNMEELLNLVDKVLKGYYNEKREARLRFHFDEVDGNSSERLFSELFDIIKDDKKDDKKDGKKVV